MANKIDKRSDPKFYAVRNGRTPGVYRTWTECQVETSGYSGAVFKAFPTYKAAADWVADAAAPAASTTATSAGIVASPATTAVPTMAAVSTPAVVESAMHKRFDSRAEAEECIRLYSSGDSNDAVGASLDSGDGDGDGEGIDDDSSTSSWSDDDDDDGDGDGDGDGRRRQRCEDDDDDDDNDDDDYSDRKKRMETRMV